MPVLISRPDDYRKAKAFAMAIVEHPAALKIAEAARTSINRTERGGFGALRWALAMAYVQGYMRGWAVARTQRSDAPPPPTMGES